MITPDKKDFKKLAATGNLIPVFCEVIADTETPVSAYRKIAFDEKGKPYPYSFLLESVEGGENIARYSFLGANPLYTFIHENGKGVLKSGRKSTPVSGKDAFEEIHNILGKYKPVKLPGLPPFSGGAVGYVSYDVISEVEPSVVQPEKKATDIPEAVFMITDSFLVFDKVRHTIKIIVQAHVENKNSADKEYEKALAKIKGIIRKLRSPLTMPPASLEISSEKIDFKSNKTYDEYCEMVNKTKGLVIN